MNHGVVSDEQVDINTYSRKRVVIYLLATQVGMTGYYAMHNMVVDGVPVYHVRHCD